MSAAYFCFRLCALASVAAAAAPGYCLGVHFSSLYLGLLEPKEN